MNDLEKFEEFFERMGVHFDRNFGCKTCDIEGEDVLSVSQAHFEFTNKQFVGVRDDEMGGFYPREK